jgi:hypothetical protein
MRFATREELLELTVCRNYQQHKVIAGFHEQRLAANFQRFSAGISRLLRSKRRFVFDFSIANIVVGEKFSQAGEYRKFLVLVIHAKRPWKFENAPANYLTGGRDLVSTKQNQIRRLSQFEL